MNNVLKIFIIIYYIKKKIKMLKWSNNCYKIIINIIVI